jgi:tripartite-type tricarboxylate transporter receptor subunit TctC
VVESQNAIFAPADTPAAVIALLNQELNRVLKNPDVRERLLVGGTEPTGGSSQLALETIKADMAKWAKVIKDLGIRED